MQKHTNFEAEISANESRLEEVKKMGNELLETDHVKSDDVRDRLADLDDLWKRLIESMTSKGRNLGQASDQQQFLRNVEDVELWLNEVR